MATSIPEPESELPPATTIHYYSFTGTEIVDAMTFYWYDNLPLDFYSRIPQSICSLSRSLIRGCYRPLGPDYVTSRPMHL